jgi:hypothetical protein
VDEREPVVAPDNRRAYHRPLVTRVDVVEDEVALASCKRTSNSQRNNSGFTTVGICRTSCRQQSNT